MGSILQGAKSHADSERVVSCWRSPRLARQFTLVSLLSVGAGGLHDLSRDPYVVRMGLDETSPDIAESRAGDETVQIEPRSGSTVNISIQGYPFRCRLPAASERKSHRQKLSLRNLAAARAAALVGECFAGPIEGTADSFKLCVSDHVSIDDAFATHEIESDQLLEEGGFEQLYVGTAAGGRSLQVRLRCECQLPPDISLREPPCRPGDEVKAMRKGRSLSGSTSSGSNASPGLSPDPTYAPAVVASSLGEDMTVFWQTPPWPSWPWTEETEEMELDRALLRRDAVSVDGRPCSEPEHVYPSFTRVLSAVQATGKSAVSEAPAVGFTRHQDFNITLATVTCCGMRALRGDQAEQNVLATDLEYQRLMAPLTGRCMRVLHVWWTYEICWPWRVRQLHLAMSGEIEGIGTVLGHFNSSKGLVRRRAVVSRQERQSAFELVASLEGDACDQTSHRWSISSGPESLLGVGGSVNPARISSVEGNLVYKQENQDGCNPFGDISLDSAVVLVRRGNCWFHTKVLHAQAAGAAAVVVFNHQHHMIDIMEGVDELPSPMIPIVLVDDSAGTRLLAREGTHVHLKKSSLDGMELERPLSTSVTFRCSALWQHRHEICIQGDEVAVKLLPSNKSMAGTRWPRSAIQILKATVAEVFRHNGSLLVTWQPQNEAEEDLGELPDVVPLNMAFHKGVPCDSDEGARIEEVAEPQACSSEFVVHVPELCAHPRLAPPRPKENQVISCVAQEATREALAQRARSNDGLTLEGDAGNDVIEESSAQVDTDAAR